MLLIEVNLTLEQKRKLLRMSKVTGKSFGELASQALADLLDEDEALSAIPKVLAVKTHEPGS
jgi:hypothetical protein